MLSRVLGIRLLLRLTGGPRREVFSQLDDHLPSSLRFRVSGFEGVGLRVEGLGFRASGLGLVFRVLGFRAELRLIPMVLCQGTCCPSIPLLTRVRV